MRSCILWKRFCNGHGRGIRARVTDEKQIFCVGNIRGKKVGRWVANDGVVDRMVRKMQGFINSALLRLCELKEVGHMYIRSG